MKEKIVEDIIKNLKELEYNIPREEQIKRALLYFANNETVSYYDVEILYKTWNYVYSFIERHYLHALKVGQQQNNTEFALMHINDMILDRIFYGRTECVRFIIKKINKFYPNYDFVEINKILRDISYEKELYINNIIKLKNLMPTLIDLASESFRITNDALYEYVAKGTITSTSFLDNLNKQLAYETDRKNK